MPGLLLLPTALGFEFIGGPLGGQPRLLVGGDPGRETSLLLHTVFQQLRAEGIGPSQVAGDMRITTSELNRHVFGLIPTAITGDAAPSPRKRPQLTVVTG